MPILSPSHGPCCTTLAGPGTLPLTLGLKSGRQNSIFALNPVACGICSFDFCPAAQMRVSRRIGDASQLGGGHNRVMSKNPTQCKIVLDF